MLRCYLFAEFLRCCPSEAVTFLGVPPCLGERPKPMLPLKLYAQVGRLHECSCSKWKALRLNLNSLWSKDDDVSLGAPIYYRSKWDPNF